MLLLIGLLFQLVASCVAQISNLDILASQSADPPAKHKFLFSLEADVNQTVWMHGFNMQSHVMENLLHLAVATNRTMVEPYYLLGIRNWEWFEQHNARLGYESVLAGIHGFQHLPISHFFNGSSLSKMLPGGMVPFRKFASIVADRHLGAYVRFHPANYSKIDAADVCHPANVAMRENYSFESHNETWFADKVHCFEEWAAGTSLTALLKDDSIETVAVHYIPMKYQEWRIDNWKNSTERMFVREAMTWNNRISNKALDFVHQHFGNEDFVAVHWRRGDRAFRAEMSMDGFIDTVLTSPEALISYVMSTLEELQISNVFLATNCGNKEELEMVLESTGAVMYPSSGIWTDSAEEAVVEQAIAALSTMYITPPGLGLPTEVNATSNFSTWVVEQRDIDGRIGTSHYRMCCGNGYSVVGIYYPVPFHHYAPLDPVPVWSYAAYVPYQGHGMVRLHQLNLNVHLNESGFMTLLGLPKGRYEASVELVDAEGTRSAEATAQVTFFVGNDTNDVVPQDNGEIFMMEQNRDYLGGHEIESGNIEELGQVSTEMECYKLCSKREECTAFTVHTLADATPKHRKPHVCYGHIGRRDSFGEGSLALETWTGVRLGENRGSTTRGRWTRCMPLRQVCLMLRDPV